MISAVSRLSLGCLSAVSLLHLEAADRNLQRVGMKCICTAVRVLRLDALLKEACHVAPRKAHA